MALSIIIAVVVAYMATFQIDAAMTPVAKPAQGSVASYPRIVTSYDVTKYGADSSGKTPSESVSYYHLASVRFGKRKCQ